MALYLKLTEPSLFGSFATLLAGFSWRMGIISEAVSSQVKCRTSVRCLVPEKKLKGKWEHKDYDVCLLTRSMRSIREFGDGLLGVWGNWL